ncbi:hypothetical protein [Cryptosporangium phraense]|uniref:Uncharacterized protein n=1 Tax=Cryptosporangium phraense TaxID=2593070 RepID=A0A545AZY4_9ACTN|nr:hypothetical protein [Cryptosporangium phraense]TQS46868.1 hypothetical protein FL583_00900 [Cryptosporangium phraense]
MTEWDDDGLKTLLAECAEDVTEAPGLVSGVHARRRRARRRMVAAAVVALIVLAGGILLWPRADDADRLQALDRPSGAVPGAPVTVGWLPAGFAEPHAHLAGPGAWSIETDRATPIGQLAIQVLSDEPVPRTKPGTLTNITLDGTPATLYTVPQHGAGAPPYTALPEAEGPYLELIYQRKPGQWIRIVASNKAGDVPLGISEDDLRRVAAGLVDGVTPIEDLVRFRSLPDGVVLSEMSGSARLAEAAFCLPGQAPAQCVSKGPGIVLTVQLANGFPRPFTDTAGWPAKAIRVGDRTVDMRLNPGLGEIEARMELADGVVVSAYRSKRLPLSWDQLARFVAGIDPGDDFPR